MSSSYPLCPYRFAAGLLAVLITVFWLGSPTFAQEHRPLPSEQYPSVQAGDSVPMEQLPFVDGPALRAEAEQHSDEIGPYRYGKVVETRYSSTHHGTWEQLPSGDWLWRLRIQSQDAVSMSLGFTRFQLPKGAELYVHGPEDELIRGPYTANDATNGQLRTPIVRGEALTIELRVASHQREKVDLKIGRVVHGYRPIHPSVRSQATLKSGTCNLDVACDEADPWRDQVRSVGMYSYEDGNTAYSCTGSLVNNTAEDRTPFFLTAEHCISTPDQAETMVFYWNYQNESCRTQGTGENEETTDDDPLDQTSSGAILRARYGQWHEDNTIEGKSDLSLVEIDDNIPYSYELYFAGWSREGQPTSEGVTIHHPNGDGKRISFDEDPSTITAYAQSGGGDTHLRIGNWETGTTEAGSSGGPLYDTQQRIVGVLSGGYAGCGGNGTAEDNDEPDWYGRIAPGFTNGDYQGATLEDWLDPLNTETQTLDGMSLSNDSIPPAPISDFRVTNVTPDSVTLQWTAPGDDGMTGTASRYELRFRTSIPQHQTDVSIKSRADFQNAQSVSAVPTPDTAGTPQSVTLSVEQDTSYYFALVALDETRNASPLVTVDHDVTPVASLQVTAPAPNPTRNQTDIRVVSEEEQFLRVALFDALGRQVSVPFDDQIPPFRQQTITIDVSSLSSGIYFARFQGKHRVQTEKISVVK